MNSNDIINTVLWVVKVDDLDMTFLTIEGYPANVKKRHLEEKPKSWPNLSKIRQKSDWVIAAINL